METTFPLITRKAARRYFSRTPSLTLEQYYHADDKMREVALMTSEREAFERDAGVSLDSDVLDAATFAKLLAYVKDNRL